MSVNQLQKLSIDVLKREQNRFSELHSTLQEELFEASEAYRLLFSSKKYHPIRSGNIIRIESSHIFCDESEGMFLILARRLALFNRDYHYSSF